MRIRHQGREPDQRLKPSCAAIVEEVSGQEVYAKKPFSPARREDRVARLKRLIIRQQEIAAALCRSGRTQQAKAARGQLLALLNQLDLMQAVGLSAAPASRGKAH